MKKLIYLLILTIFPSVFYGNISVNKSYILFENNTRNENITIVNQGDEEKTYRIGFVYYKQNIDGSYSKLSENDPNFAPADKYLDYTPKIFTLKPKGSQLIRFQKKSMAEDKDREYTSQLLIEEQPKKATPDSDETLVKNGLKVDINPLFSLTVPLIVRKGNLEATNTIKSYKFKQEYGKLNLTVNLTRKGTKSSRGNLLLKSGNEVIAKMENINIFMTSDERQVNLIVAETPEKEKEIKNKLKEELTLEYIDSSTAAILASKVITK